MRSDGGPSLEELSALAARALERLPGEGLVDVLWERGITVALTARQDGHAARVVAGDLDDEHLARAARAAALRARRTRAWPAPPVPVTRTAPPGRRTAPGFLPVDEPAAQAAAGTDIELTWDAGAARTAVAATTGLRAAEERTHAVARLSAERPDGRAAVVHVAGTGWAPGGGAPVLDAAGIAGAARELRALLGEEDGAGSFGPRVPPARRAPPDGSVPVVLGPEAVAAVLDQVRGSFGVDLALGAGPIAGRLGQPVAAGVVTLRDDAGHRLTLPRSGDAEGVPRDAVVLIRDGTAVGQVHDSASALAADAATTGHATRPLTPAPAPDHLVLDGGDAKDVAALVAEVRDGLFLPALGPVLDRTDDGRVHAVARAGRISAGRLSGHCAPGTVEVRAMDVLATVQALTGAQRLVALRSRCPGGSGAAVVPAVLAAGGVRAGP